MKRNIIFILAIILVISGFQYNHFDNASASTKKTAKTKLSKKNVQIYTGKTISITLRNPNKKVKWSVSNKKIVKITKKTGAKNNKITIKGLKAGKTKVTAKCGKKNYAVTVKVNDKAKEIETSTKTSTKTPSKTPPLRDCIKEIEIQTKVQEDFYISATVLNEKVTVGDDLQIKLRVVGNVKKSFYYEAKPGILEKKVDEEWVQMPLSPGAFWEEVLYSVYSGQDRILTVPLSRFYNNLTIGHYRYTKDIEDMSVSVEFDIESNEEGYYISATVENKKIIIGDLVKIRYSIIGNTDKTIYFKPEAGRLYKKVNGDWVTIFFGADERYISWPDVIYTLSKGFDEIYTVPYDNLTVGHYCYIRNIDGAPVSVEFDIKE